MIGAAHAGWRGAHGGVLANTVAAMVELGAVPARIAAAVGPCIAQTSYEVSDDFRGAFTDADDRFFAPGCGVDEDPATGSAHCILGPMWADRLGRSTVRFRQVFPGRGGDIETETRGDRVLLRGRAMTVIESRLRL